jgi:cell division protein FtsI/penicillin-binding protein 2
MRRKQADNNNIRINAVIAAFFCACLIFIGRLFQIQVLSHNTYKALASEQYRDLQTIPSKRGDILSSDGFILATTQNHYLVYMEPKKVVDKYEVVEELSKYLSKIKAEDPSDKEETDKLYLSYKERFSGIADSDLIWAILEHALTPPQKEEIEKFGFEGIGFQEEPVRYYPEKHLAAHVLGFVASNEKGEKQGYYGIEGRLDGELKGKVGRVVEEKDALGTPILVGDHKMVEPIDGGTVVLTINRSVQHIVETKLKEGVEKYDAVSGSVIVMEPYTGEILALANYPTYDPANFTDEEKESTTSPHRSTIERTNLAIAETYEPGSVIKPLTISAAIDLGKVTPSTTFEDKGPVNYSGYFIDNWDGKHHGVQTIVQLLQKSNNIGAAWVGHLVGSKNVYKYFSDFGIGQRPGVDLEGEDTGVLRDYKGWTDIDLANISFGQGMSATPLQVLTAFNAIANGGKLMQPQIISSINGEDGVTDIPPKEIREVISRKTSETMVGMLTQAVSGGEAAYFVSKVYDVAGKTGTAQIPKDGKYDPSKTNATFVGFLAKSKKFSMIVRLDRPSTSTYAAETAVPLWMEITDELVKYFGIPPDREIPNPTPKPVPTPTPTFSDSAEEDD